MLEMINKENLIRARKRAKEIREKYNLSGPGVNLNELIDNYNNSDKDAKIIAKEIDLSELQRYYDKALSGFIQKQDDKIFIGIQISEPSYRKRFTLAHELGHLFLGHINDDPSQIDFRKNIDALDLSSFGLYSHDEREQEANEFAAELLMPEEEIRKLYKAIDDHKILAEIFGVSYQAMYIRLKRLGLI